MQLLKNPIPLKGIGFLSIITYGSPFTRSNNELTRSSNKTGDNPIVSEGRGTVFYLMRQRRNKTINGAV